MADCTTYLQARNGSTNWDALADDTAREKALRQAARYLEGRYRGRWKGQKVRQANALAWPRENVTDAEGFSIGSDEIPQVLIDAQCVLAEIMAGTTHDLEPVLGASDFATRKKVGPIEVSFEGGAPSRKIVTTVNGLLSGLVEVPFGTRRNVLA